MSDDGTREIIEDLAGKHPHLRVVDNPHRIVSSALNAAIRLATGSVIVRMDAHTDYAPDYIRRCYEVLAETGSDNVGGPWIAHGEGYVSRAIAAALPPVRASKLRALGVTAARRSAELPNVPTIAESGVAGYEAAGWNALLAPRATPHDIIAKVNGAVVESLNAPRVREILVSSGAEAAAGAPEALARFIEREVAKWGKVVRTAGIKPE